MVTIDSGKLKFVCAVVCSTFSRLIAARSEIPNLRLPFQPPGCELPPLLVR